MRDGARGGFSAVAAWEAVGATGPLLPALYLLLPPAPLLQASNLATSPAL